jgi:hypothetical protein
MSRRITYSTNWMGPVATRWYEEKNIPYVLKMTSGRFGPAKEYKDFTESYSCGRIDELETPSLHTYKELISNFEKDYEQPIRWITYSV